MPSWRSRTASAPLRNRWAETLSVALLAVVVVGIVSSCDHTGSTDSSPLSTDPTLSSDGSVQPTSEVVPGQATPETMGTNPGAPTRMAHPGGVPPTGDAVYRGGAARGDGRGDGGGGGVGGAPRGVLLIEAGGDWKPWLAQQNQECVRAGAASGCLTIEYASYLYDPRDPANYNCSVQVQTPANGERRNNQTFLPVGTTVTVEATCERGDPPTTNQPTERTTDATPEVSPSAAPATTDTPEPGHRNQHGRGSEHANSGGDGGPGGQSDK